MAASNKGYSTFADFERDQLRPDMRIGFTTEELESSGEELDFDMDPFDAAFEAGEADYEDD